MRKSLVFCLVLVAIVAVVWARVPVARNASAPSGWPSAITGIENNSDEVTIPVRFMSEGSGGHQGGNPLDVVDSSMFTDDYEGGHPAWISADLASGDYWHVQAFNGFGTNSSVLQCGDPRLSNVCDTAYGGYNNHWLQYLVLDAVDLSSASSPVFSFTANWRVEPLSGGWPAGYDAWDTWNVWGSTDNGTTWNVLTPTSPSYNCTSSFAFGDEWGMGVGIPGYTDSSAAPVTCTFSLASLVGSSQAKVRVAFCSDPAASTGDGQLPCTRFGLLVDNLSIQDGANNLYSNSGVAGGWTNETGPVSPDVWVYDNSTSHSPTHSWNGQQTAFNVKRGIYSYPVILPAGYQKLKMTYWVWCDLPDFQGSGGSSLEDYYQISYSTNDGATWNQSVYDYAYDNGEAAPGGNSLNGWVQRTRGLNSGGIQSVDIPLITGTGAAPETIRVAFEVILDGDNNGGSGTGLHVDDVEFIAQRAQNIDLATRDMIIPLPTTVGLARPWKFRFVNEGLSGLSPVRGKLRFTRPDGTFLPPSGDSVVVIAGVLNYGQDTLVQRVYTPDQAGAWVHRVIANATGEQDRTNDTTYSPTPNANPDLTLAPYARRAGVYELGYGRRAVNSAYLQTRYEHVTPLADGVPAGDAGNFDMLQLRVMWQFNPDFPVGGAHTLVSFWNEGPDTFHTGSLIYSTTVTIDTGQTIGAAGTVRWWDMNLSTIPALHNRSGNFWVSLAALDTTGLGDGVPLPLGTSLAGIAGSADAHNYFRSAGADSLTQSGGRLLINVVIGQAVEDLTIHRGAALSTDIVLNWSAAAGASKYYVWRLTTPNQVYNTGTNLTPSGIVTNTFTDVGRVSTGTKDFYVVIAEY